MWLELTLTMSADRFEFAIASALLWTGQQQRQPAGAQWAGSARLLQKTIQCNLYRLTPLTMVLPPLRCGKLVGGNLKTCAQLRAAHAALALLGPGRAGPGDDFWDDILLLMGRNETHPDEITSEQARSTPVLALRGQLVPHARCRCSDQPTVPAR